MLNEREVKHLDQDDNEEMQEGETVMAFWSADKEFYEAAIIKISGECLIKNKLGVESVRGWMRTCNQCITCFLVHQDIIHACLRYAKTGNFWLMIIIIFIFKPTKNKPTTLSDSVAKCPKAVKSE